jgi:hypothetical protein
VVKAFGSGFAGLGKEKQKHKKFGGLALFFASLAPLNCAGCAVCFLFGL